MQGQHWHSKHACTAQAAGAQGQSSQDSRGHTITVPSEACSSSSEQGIPLGSLPHNSFHNQIANPCWIFQAKRSVSSFESQSICSIKINTLLVLSRPRPCLGECRAQKRKPCWLRKHIALECWSQFYNNDIRFIHLWHLACYLFQICQQVLDITKNEYLFKNIQKKIQIIYLFC